MDKRVSQEIKVGLFVSMGVLALMSTVIILGGPNFMDKTVTYKSYFDTVDGLVAGAKVMNLGIQVGVISAVEYNPEKKQVGIELSVSQKYRELVRAGTQAEINTQGVLGDKFVNLTRGQFDQPELPEGSEIPSLVSQGLAGVLSKSDHLMENLSQITGSVNRILKTFEKNGRSDQLFQSLADTSKNLSSATSKLNAEIDSLQLKNVSKSVNLSLEHLNSITAKINNGTGTIGALVNDPSVYDDLKSLLGGANRNRIVRNLVRDSVKKNDEKKESSE